MAEIRYARAAPDEVWQSRSRMILKRSRLPEIGRHQSVVLYPTFGHVADDGCTWRVHIAGVVYEPGTVNLQKRILLRLLRQVMQVQPEAFGSEIFRERIRGFIAATERGKRVHVRLGGDTYRLQKKTKRNGHFRGTIRLSPDHLDRLADQGEFCDDWLHFHAVAPDGDQRVFSGRARLIGPVGVSVISDIDDTMKHSEVSCKRLLLANTFLREFQSIDGMAARYRGWFDEGVAFHYVSSSPWQLYDPLADLCHSAAFPPGTFHLRSFRLRDHMLRHVLLIRRPGKSAVIKSILMKFPRRRFVLIGDSAERDPEIYGSMARKFPGQVQSIFIREVPERPLDHARSQKVFRNIAPHVWSVFHDSRELPDCLTTASAVLV